MSRHLTSVEVMIDREGETPISIFQVRGNYDKLQPDLFQKPSMVMDITILIRDTPSKGFLSTVMLVFGTVIFTIHTHRQVQLV